MSTPAFNQKQNQAPLISRYSSRLLLGLIFIATLWALTTQPAVAQQVNFGNQTVGTTSAAQSLGCCSNPNSLFSISYRTSVTGPNFRTGPGNTCSVNGTLSPHQSCNFSVVFSPQSAGPKTAVATYVYIGDPNSTQTWTLSGTGVAPPSPTAPPTFNLAGGTYVGSISVSIADTTPGTVIYWARGTMSTSSFVRYTGPVTISSSETLRAFGIAPGRTQSSTVSAVYQIQTPVPTFSPAGGLYSQSQPITLHDIQANAVIYYALDATIPVASFTRYTSPITVLATQSIRAFASTEGQTQSSIVTATYTVRPRAWSSVLPLFSGSVRNIVLDAARNLYVVTNGAIFRSSNAGLSWISASGDLTAAPSGQIAADPNSPGILYASAADGVYKTTNGGLNWRKTAVNLAGTSVTGIAIARDKVYVATYGASLQCSSDSGVTFSVCSGGISGTVVTSVAVNPLNSNEAYSSTWRGLLYHTVNGGASWLPIGGSGPWTNTQIYIAPSNPNVLYVTTDGLVKKSVDAGQSWIDAGLPDGIANDVSELAISPLDSQAVLATTSKGLFKTVAAGGTWAQVFAPPVPFQNLASIALDGNGSDLYVGSPYSGFYRSVQGGPWEQENSGIASANIIGLEVCQSNSSTIYVGTQGVGLNKSTNGGNTWAVVSMPPGLQNETLSGIACDPKDSFNLLVSGYGSLTGDIWRSTDGAATFSSVAHGYWPGVIAFNPIFRNQVVAGLQDYQGGSALSQNGGSSWTVPYFWHVYPSSYAFHPVSDIIFAVANEYTGAAVDTVNVAYSSDTGSTWHSYKFGQGDFIAVALDQRDTSTLYVAGTIATEGVSGVFKFKITYSGAGVSSITRIPGTFNTGLSTDVRQLIYDAGSGRLYAATGNGVYFSDNQASTWTSLGEGLPYLSVSKIALSSDGSLLYAGTNGGVYVISTR